MKRLRDALQKLLTRRWLAVNGVLIVVLIVLVNVAGSGTYFRADLTARNVYSLSPVSHEVMRSLDDPMKVKVFFSEDVPAVYSTVRRYLLDILREYDNAGSDRFSYEVFSMTSPEHRSQASDYGISPIQIREIREDEFQQRQAYLGVAFVYGDAVETVNGITSTEGLEYRLTTTMQSMVRKVSTLAGVSGSVDVTLYASRNLDGLGLGGMDTLETDLRSAVEEVDTPGGDTLQFALRRPGERSRIEELVERFGLQRITWQSEEGEALGTLGVVLSYDERFETVPIRIVRTLVGGYRLEGIESVREKIEGKLSVLLDASPRLVYVTGHGEAPLSDARRGASRFRQLLSDLYQVEEIDLSNEPIPAGTQTVVINGPRREFSEWELYQLDQFLMRGGSVLAFLDPFRQRGGGQGRRAVYEPVNTGLEKLLAHYGVEVRRSYVMDTQSYVARQQNRRDVPVYNAPLLSDDSLNEENVITENLNQVLFLNSSSVAISGDATTADGTDGDETSGDETTDDGSTGNGTTNEAHYTWLARTSENGWTMSENITLNPLRIRPPQSEEEQDRRNLAVLAEGTFASYFDEAVAPPEDDAEESGQAATAGEGPDAAPGASGASGGDTASEGTGAPDGAGRDNATPDAAGTAESADTPSAGGEQADIAARRHVARSTSTGRLIVAGTSELTGPELLGQQQRGPSPNAILVQNMVDYLNGNVNVPPMRTKGLAMNRLPPTGDTVRTLIRVLHVGIVPLFVVLAGLAVWAGRRRYRRLIRQMVREEGAS